jgi:hypothetical protein
MANVKIITENSALGSHTALHNVAVKCLISLLCFQAENPHAALNFYWEPLKKAVSISKYAALTRWWDT